MVRLQPLRDVVLWTESLANRGKREIYSDPLVSPQAETYRGNVDCTGTRSMYDESASGMSTISSGVSTYPVIRDRAAAGSG